MQVAVITPYYRESLELLETCHRSVAAQVHECRHVLVADGHPQASLDDWPIDHLCLPQPHNDIGSTPRLIGAIHAIGLGADVICFLDADNWYSPDYVATVVACIASTGAAFVSCSRQLHDLNGRYLAECPNTDPQRFVDTNCMAFARPAFGLLSQWVLMPRYAHLIGDRVILHHVRCSELPMQHLHQALVHYRCGKAGIYRQLGLPLPSGVSEPPDYAASFRQWVADGNPPLY